MLVELSVVEQRYQAVLAVIRDGVSIVQVAHRFGPLPSDRERGTGRGRPSPWGDVCLLHQG
jgi:hypothetical protein